MKDFCFLKGIKNILIFYCIFLFSKSAHPLNADERKRHEFVDCLLIELIRTEILPYAGILPRDFMQRIIEILNRGSINTLDINDVIGRFLNLIKILLKKINYFFQN